MKLSKAIPLIVGTLIFASMFFFIKELMDKKFISQNEEKIKIGINEWPGYAPLVLAKLNGMLERENLNIELILFSGQAESNEKFMAKELDGVFTVLSDTLILKTNGASPNVVLVTDYSLTGDAIVAKPEIKSIKNLKNKKIGIDSLNSFSHMFALEALKKFDINENEVEFVIVPYDRIDQALTNNEVSAAHSWDPGKKKAVDLGNKIIFTAGEIPGLILDTLCFQEDFIKKHPNEIKKIVKIFYEAQEEMIKEPEKSAQKLAGFFKNDPKNFFQSFSDIHFVTNDEFKNLLIGDNPNSLEKQIKKYKKFYEERGQLNINENFDNLLYAGGVN